MGREPVTETILGVKITSSPLPFPLAQELLPDVLSTYAVIGGSFAVLVKGGLKGVDDLGKLGPAGKEIGAHLGGGKLVALTPKLLATTYAVLEQDGGADPIKYDLSKADERNAFFDERPDLYIPALSFAGRVTFARFFPGKGRGGGATPAP